MPVKVEKMGSKFRVVEKSGRVAKNAAGTAVDGGGHSTRKAAESQAAAINSKTEKK